jgi:glycosyltransferase involved in cell wall biosynthesis
MTGRYQFPFSTNSAYGRAVDLLSNLANEGGCVMDLGCGFGTYIGFDLDIAGVKSLRERGFEAYETDLLEDSSIEETLAGYLGDRILAGVVMLDVLEHLTNPSAVLGRMRALLSTRPPVPLVLSVPNVTHFELAAKLLQGRWDVTEVGLLDDTHVSFFSAARLEEVTRGAGWLQVAEQDFRLQASDQHFPADDVAFLADTPLHQMLRMLRSKAEGSGTVNQFVRAYLPGPRSSPAPTEVAEPPLLTVLTRTQGRRSDTLQESLLCLAAQECADFECLVLAHDVAPDALGHIRYMIDSLPPHMAGKVRLIPVTGGGRSQPLNVGVAEARGRYVAILDDDDLVFAHWVEEFRVMADKRPGRVLRAGVVVQDAAHDRWLDRVEYRNIGGFRAPYPEFDLIAHLEDNYSPPCGLAFPRSCFRDLGIRFDDDLPVLEDWDVLLQAAMLCGVVETTEVTSVYRWWQKGDSSLERHSMLEWESARTAVIRRMDSAPLMLPQGSVSQIREMKAETVRRETLIRDLRAENFNLRNDCDWLRTNATETNDLNERKLKDLTTEFQQSASWRLTAPLRAAAFSLRWRKKSDR